MAFVCMMQMGVPAWQFNDIAITLRFSQDTFCRCTKYVQWALLLSLPQYRACTFPYIEQIEDLEVHRFWQILDKEVWVVNRNESQGKKVEFWWFLKRGTDLQIMLFYGGLQHVTSWPAQSIVNYSTAHKAHVLGSSDDTSQQTGYIVKSTILQVTPTA